jgi:hypothetical protein
MKKVKIETVDGACASTWKAEVLPGPRTIGVSYVGGFLNAIAWSTTLCFVTFEAEAGHKDQISGEYLFGQQWRCWVEDSDTRKHIDGSLTAR